MKADANATLVLDLVFGKTAQVGRFLRDAAELKIRRNILRARVTSHGAWMSVTLQGPSERLGGLAARWHDCVRTARFEKQSA